MTMKIKEFVTKLHCGALGDEEGYEELLKRYAPVYLLYAGLEDEEIALANEELDKNAKETYLKLKAYFEPEEVTPEND
jgi:hypothetical protein